MGHGTSWDREYSGIGGKRRLRSENIGITLLHGVFSKLLC